MLEKYLINSVNQIRAVKHRMSVRLDEKRYIREFPARYGSIKEIVKVNFKVTAFRENRINLILPSINKESLFGGASTAIKLFEEFQKYYENSRIITTHDIRTESLSNFSSYKLVLSEEDLIESKQVFSIAGLSGEANNPSFFIGSNDIFIATCWTTAALIQRIVRWQSEIYNSKVKPFVYLIQDYEPGFYAWSSQYVLARKTYEYEGPTIAVFNSNLLREYFHNQNHRFKREFTFEPKINQSLLHLRSELEPKHKQILVYGRPSVPRNAFNLIFEALRIWVEEYPNASDWKVLSAGEAHPDLSLNNQITMKSLGKLNLSDYAHILNKSSIGLSMMISPHPSYPPLEMAHYGLWVLTNNYDNKDLSKFHDNINSLSDVSPENIARNLQKLCCKVENDPTAGWKGNSNMKDYMSGISPFTFLDELFNSLNN